ncbi:hypothetical protein Rsub_12497 [Raphidocelis subcapitata]|uniref:Gamma-secretase subunit PEN-2 n=1 Tax=Raphidocelis subcapitata TaxID=307507 RepID=A0A2V0PQR8_9CHLO|nr:hypothetical protein Rsub_12497 [Raphidocelis subcapitata]|eukprot:GBF99857.1 hypothetical protein Rsub_12497 [Raphidocelis subcapitata]
MDSLAVESVDGEVFTVEQARTQSQRYKSGFACLPLFWGVNVWLFYPTFRGAPAADPVVKKYTRYSAACFTASSALFLTWLLVFAVGGPAVLGQRLFDKLDATRLDVWGILTGGA